MTDIIAGQLSQRLQLVLAVVNVAREDIVCLGFNLFLPLTAKTDERICLVIVQYDVPGGEAPQGLR